MAAALVSLLAACSGDGPAGVDAPQSSQGPVRAGERLSAYFAAWAANEPNDMIRNSAPGSPARSYARYWSDLLRAGRVDAAAAQVEVRADRAILRYEDGTEYVLADVATDPRGRVVTWRTDPGGPLARRIVAGPAKAVEVGPAVVVVRRQYRNSEGGLRITMAVRNTTDQTARLGLRAYVSRDGRRLPGSLGSGGSTGEVAVPGRDRAAVVAAVPGARPGGSLVLYAYARDRQVPQSARVELPR